VLKELVYFQHGKTVSVPALLNPALALLDSPLLRTQESDWAAWEESWKSGWDQWQWKDEQAPTAGEGLQQASHDWWAQGGEQAAASQQPENDEQASHDWWAQGGDQAAASQQPNVKEEQVPTDQVPLADEEEEWEHDDWFPAIPQQDEKVKEEDQEQPAKTADQDEAPENELPPEVRMTEISCEFLGYRGIMSP
jgi:hypothetical protein